MVRKEIHRPDYSDTLLLEAVCRALLQGETTAKENGSIKSWNCISAQWQ